MSSTQNPIQHSEENMLDFILNLPSVSPMVQGTLLQHEVASGTVSAAQVEAVVYTVHASKLTPV